MPINKGYMTAKRTPASDEAYTPSFAVLPLIEFIKAKHFKTIWCPFDNDDSHFVKEFKKAGLKVINTHIKTGQDFFKIQPPKQYDIIISNPPWSLKDRVINKCYELKKSFALLLPIATLQSKTRYNNFKKGLELLVFDERIGFYANGHIKTTQNGAPFASIYFCKNFLPDKLIFRSLKEHRQITGGT